MKGKRKAKVESLERRVLLSVSLNTTTGLLSIHGTSANDQIALTTSGLNLNVVEAGSNFSFTKSQVKAVQVDLAAGADKVTVDASITAPATLTAGSGPDTLIGGGGNTTLFAGSGDDSLMGSGPANDYVFGPQSSTLTYVLNQAGKGQNRLDFTALPAGNAVTVNTAMDLLASYANVTVQDAIAGQFINFNQIYGGQGDDTLSANNGGDTIVAGDGSNYLYGGTGPDLIRAGNGYDVINGNGGADTIYGGGGKDVIYAIDSNSDPIYSDSPVVEPTTPASPGVLIYAGSGTTSIVGGPGNDTIYAGSGNDTIHGMGGNDSIIGDGGDAVIFGDSGNDTITAGSGNTTIGAGNGQDVVYGGTGPGTTFIDKNLPDEKSTAQDGAPIDAAALTANAIAAAKGQAKPTYPELGSGPGDIVVGRGGKTTIIGGAGNDTLRGGDGGSTVVAGTGNDLLIAGIGSDYLQGGSGDDTLAAGDGPDLMVGGTGDTTFLNLNGFPDTLVGGGGLNVDQTDPTGKTVRSNIQVDYVPLYSITITKGLGTSGTFVAPVSGTLFCLFNDTFNAYGDNTGSFTLTFNGIKYIVEGNNSVGVPIPVTAGKSYKYTATGLINNGTGTTFGPQGNASHNSVSKYTPDPNANYGSLIGLFRSAIPAAAVAGALQATPAVPPPVTPPLATVSAGVLHVGSSTFTGPQQITISENANGIVTVSQANVGVQTFAAAGIKLVSVLGGSGSDSIDISALPINAIVNAGNGNNFVSGGAGNDTLRAGSGNDTLIGGIGKDTVSGGAGNNLLYGGTGNDVINGGSGSDWIYPGGFGVSLYADAESDTINGGSGSEKVDLAGNADPETIRLDKGTITDNITHAVTTIKNVRNLWAGAGNDLIVGGTASGVLLVAGSGNDTMFGISASDVIYGGAGNDGAFLDGNQGFLGLFGNHAGTPGNFDNYNQGTTIIPPSVDASDIKIVQQHPPP